MIAIVAVGAALVSVALPDGVSDRLDEEGERLTALLEMARAESRVSGMPVYWVPRTDTGAPGAQAEGSSGDFRFVGLPAALSLPTRWLDARVSAQVVGGSSLVLGPSAILPAQRVVLQLADRRLELLSDGLGPFAIAEAGAGSVAPAR